MDKKWCAIYNIDMDNVNEPKNRKCPRCGSTEGRANHGFDKAGGQRCLCKTCGYRYTLVPKYSEELKKEAIRLYKSGLSGRAVANILKVNKGSVYNWAKKYGNDI